MRLYAFFVLVAALAFGRPVAAQDANTVYAAADLSTPPKLANAMTAARLVANSYPDQLKRAGVNGTVQVQFVVGADGKVEPGSVEVVAATLPALGEAAKQVAEKIEFKPGLASGKPVRSRVMLPIVYKAQ
jgi:periplasmic protein TonB